MKRYIVSRNSNSACICDISGTLTTADLFNCSTICGTIVQATLLVNPVSPGCPLPIRMTANQFNISDIDFDLFASTYAKLHSTIAIPVSDNDNIKEQSPSNHIVIYQNDNYHCCILTAPAFALLQYIAPTIIQTSVLCENDIQIDIVKLYQRASFTCIDEIQELLTIARNFKPTDHKLAEDITILRKVCIPENNPPSDPTAWALLKLNAAELLVLRSIRQYPHLLNLRTVQQLTVRWFLAENSDLPEKAAPFRAKYKEWLFIQFGNSSHTREVNDIMHDLGFVQKTKNTGLYWTNLQNRIIVTGTLRETDLFTGQATLTTIL